MARGTGKDPREDFAIDRLRFRSRAQDPPVAPPKNHCEIYVKDGALYKIDGGDAQGNGRGKAGPIGGIGVSASPGFTWGRQGPVLAGAYLFNDRVPSNDTGRLIIFGSPVIRKVLVTNSTASTCTVTVQEHDGTTFTDLASVTLSAERSKAVDFAVSATSGKELAVKVTSGSCTNPVVGVILDGTFS